MNIVWFKRDLRTTDHRPLYEASQSGLVVGLYVIEDKWLAASEFSQRHLVFISEALRDLKFELSKLKIPLIVLRGDFPQVLERFKDIKAIWA